MENLKTSKASKTFKKIYSAAVTTFADLRSFYKEATLPTGLRWTTSFSPSQLSLEVKLILLTKNCSKLKDLQKFTTGNFF